MNTEFTMKKWLVDEVMSSHTLIAGTTGSGKSVLLNDLLIAINSYSSEYGDPICVFFDLKRVELCQYKLLKGFCAGYVTEPRQVLSALDWAIDKMEARYREMNGRKKSSRSPLILVIDELADLVSIKGALDRLIKIGRLGRAANVRLLCATQDPSRRTLSAQFMQNVTCSIALRCRSAIESRQIIGVPGAELLPRYGKALVYTPSGLDEFEIPYVPEEWVEAYIAGRVLEQGA